MTRKAQITLAVVERQIYRQSLQNRTYASNGRIVHVAVTNIKGGVSGWLISAGYPKRKFNINSAGIITLWPDCPVSWRDPFAEFERIKAHLFPENSPVVVADMGEDADTWNLYDDMMSEGVHLIDKTAIYRIL